MKGETMDTEKLPAHARLSPSSSKRWLACPGSARWDLPDSTNPASQAGDVGHDLADSYLRSDDLFKDLSLLEDEVFEQVQAHLDVDKAAEIAKAVGFYIETVEKYTKGATSVSFENKLFHEWIPDFYGTIDCAIYTPGAEYELTIVDLKTGTYKVPAKNNTQLQSYACLARQEYPTDNFVRCVICQDRVYAKPQVAYFSPDELDAFESRVDKAGRSDELVAGSHCRFCPIQSGCRVYAAEFGEPA